LTEIKKFIQQGHINKKKKVSMLGRLLINYSQLLIPNHMTKL